MKTTVSIYDFRRAFADCGRESQFSYEALGILFEAIEQLDSDCGVESELDVVALCCEFEESHWQDIAVNYEIDLTQYDDDEERIMAVQDYIQDHAMYCGITDDGCMVYSQF